MKSNSIILILIFFSVGYFLYFREKSGPIDNLWKVVTGVFESKSSNSEEKNLYKSPEPDAETTSTNKAEKSDNNASESNKKDKKNSNDKPENDFSIFDRIKDKIFNSDTQEENSDNGEIPDFALPFIGKGDEIIKHKN